MRFLETQTSDSDPVDLADVLEQIAAEERAWLERPRTGPIRYVGRRSSGLEVYAST